MWCVKKQPSEVFYMKKVFLKTFQNSQENTCARVSFVTYLQASCKFVKKETLTQVFSCEFCKIFKNTFFAEHLRTVASVFPLHIPLGFNDLELMNYGILHYLWSADLSKSFYQLIMSLFIFSQYFFFNRFCSVEKCEVTLHCLYRDW